MTAVLNAVRTVLRPFHALLQGHEPAIAAALIAAAGSIAAHYGLDLTAQQQTYVSGAALLLANWVVRQSVVPIAKLPEVDDTATDAELEAGQALGSVLYAVAVVIAVIVLAKFIGWFALILLLLLVLLV